MIFKRVFPLLVLTLIALPSIRAQGTKEFVSYTGGFKIGISERPSGTNGMGSGVRFVWNLGETEYEIGFYERQGLPLAVVDGEFSYEGAVNKYFNRFSQQGTRVYEREISHKSWAGKEYKYKLRDSTYLLRLFLVDDRVYQLQARFPLDNAQSEKKAVDVFDSIHILEQETVQRHFATLIGDATPGPLPQSPRAPKLTTDLQDRNLRGNVKGVLTEIAYYALNDSLKQRKRKLLEEFDEAGNLLKQIEYDSYGAPMTVRVFGYVDAKRVARVGSIPSETSPGGMAVSFGSSRKPDSRFDESTLYRYVGGKLVEERSVWSNGVLFARTTYRTSGNTRETQYFDGGSKPFGKSTAVLDDRGNETRITYFEQEGGKLVEEAPYDIAYEAFDERGNWTRRLTTRWYGLGNKGKTFPEHVEYRTVLYHR